MQKYSPSILGASGIYCTHIRIYAKIVLGNCATIITGKNELKLAVNNTMSRQSLLHIVACWRVSWGMLMNSKTGHNNHPRLSVKVLAKSLTCFGYADTLLQKNSFF